MHVIHWLIISSSWNSCIRASLCISSKALHTFIISYDSDFDSSLVSFDDFPCEIIIGEREDTKINRFFSQSNIATKFLNVRLTWEEESILVLSLWSQKILLKFTNHLSQSLQCFLIFVGLHLAGGNLESLRYSIINGVLLKPILTHVGNNFRKVVKVNF